MKLKHLAFITGLMLCASIARGWETATTAEIGTYLNANYAWWGNVQDGSAHGTYVERTVSTVKINADGSVSPAKLHFTFNTADGLYRWMGTNPTAPTPASFDADLKAYLNSFITAGTIEAWEIIAQNSDSQFATVKAWQIVNNVIAEKLYLIDKDGANVRIREISQP